MNKVQRVQQSARTRLANVKREHRTGRAIGKISRKGGLIVGAKWMDGMSVAGIPMGLLAGIVADGVDLLFAPSGVFIPAALDFVSGVGDADLVGVVQRGRLAP